MNKIVPTLWFDSEAEQAAEYYVGIFKDGEIGPKMFYNESSAKVSGRPAGSVLTVEFTIRGQKFVALNGRPAFKFNEAVSFAIECIDQQEIDSFWDALTADGGEESYCGWLKDKFGLFWQVVPKGLDGLFRDKDPERVERVTQAMLGMRKLDIEELQRAFHGSAPANP
jgi:predicted 3-demethylubiquinone-9 3-methyltransferase (glyoxalase superfamily)